MEPTNIFREYLPQLPLSERDRRWNMLRGWMDEKGVDCVLVIANDMTFNQGVSQFRYLANSAPRHGGFIVFPRRGEPCILAEPWHMQYPVHPCALASDWIADCRPNKKGREAIDGAIDEVFARGDEGLSKVALVWGPKYSRNGKEPYKEGAEWGEGSVSQDNMPHIFWERIQERFKGVEIVDGSGFFFKMRSIKSEAELDMLRKAGRIHHKMLMTNIEMAREGVRENELFAAMMATQISAGAECQDFLLLSSGPVNSEKKQHLLHGLETNFSPTARPLQKGDVVVSESHVSYGGYMSAAEFSVCIGKPPAEYEYIYKTVVECFNAAKEFMRPGHAWREVIETERKIIKQHNLTWLELGFHGHGLSSPEHPKCVLMDWHIPDDEAWRRFSAEALDVPFQKNMVIGTNGDIYNPNWRNDVGVMFGDTVIIAEEPEVLVNTPQELVVN